MDGIADSLFKKKHWDKIKIGEFNWRDMTDETNYNRDKKMNQQEIGWNLARKL